MIPLVTDFQYRRSGFRSLNDAARSADMVIFHFFFTLTPSAMDVIHYPECHPCSDSLDC